MDVTRIRQLPAGLEALVRASAAEGFRFLERLSRDWDDGTNRFTLPGESLFEAREGGVLLGICGLNRDPYQTDADVGRVRHLYVLPAARRRGIGRCLVEHVMRSGQERFRAVRVRTSTEEGDRFYRALGFEPTVDDPRATHRLCIREARDSGRDVCRR